LGFLERRSLWILQSFGPSKEMATTVLQGTTKSCLSLVLSVRNDYEHFIFKILSKHHLLSHVGKLLPNHRVPVPADIYHYKGVGLLS